MIITEKVNVKPLAQTSYYRSLGYRFDKAYNLVEINVIDLPKNSSVKVKCECDICGNIKETEYKYYIKNIKNYNIYCCNNKCAQIKNKKTNLKKYGDECANRTDIVKEKVRNNNLEKYGVSNPMMLERNKQKLKNSNIKKYGVCSTSELNEVKEKVRKNNLEKYGVDSYFKSDDFKEKRNKTNLEKYNNEVYFKSDDFKQKKKSYLLNLNVNNISLLKDIQKKIKETNLEKYGVCYALQLDKCKMKLLEANIKKYNKTHHFKSDEIKNKIKKTNLEKYGVDNISKYENNKKIRLSNNDNKMLSFYHAEFTDDYKILEYRDKKCKFLHKLCNCETIIDNILLYSRLKNNLEICMECNPKNNHISSHEIELKKYIKELDIFHIENDRKVLNGKELDIYIPDYNLAIEFNGLYWHSTKYRENDYHLNKSLECDSKGIKLIHIFEDTWNLKKDSILKFIKNILSNPINLNINLLNIYKPRKNIFNNFLFEFSIFDYKFNNENDIICFEFENKIISIISFIKKGDTIHINLIVNNDVKYNITDLIIEYFKTSAKYIIITTDYSSYYDFSNKFSKSIKKNHKCFHILKNKRINEQVENSLQIYNCGEVIFKHKLL